MKARIVRIGNSQGIRIPKPLLEESGLTVEVELEARPDQIVIRSVRRPRADWAEAFQAMAAHGDDMLRDSTAEASAWDQEEWEW